MLTIIVICAIIVIWLLKKESNKTVNSNDASKENETQSIADDDFDDFVKEESLTEDSVVEATDIEDSVLEESTAEDDINQAELSYNIDEILKLKNKDFAFKCLYILSEENKKYEVEKLTDVDYCKDNFDMNYAILQEVDFYTIDEKVFMDNSGYRRYYPDIITLFDKKYIVCNDWFYNNKSTQRDTRTPFIRWVVR